MSDSSMQAPTPADPSSIFEGFATAIGISVALVVFDGMVLAGGLLARTAHFWPIFLLLSPLLILAFVCTSIVLARRGRQRAFNGFVATMVLVWLPLIALSGWMLHDIQAHGLGVLPV